MKTTRFARILAASLLASAVLSSAFADALFDVSGRAVDATTSAPVQDASVRLAVDGLSTTTDASGNFRLLKQSTALSGAVSSARAEFLPASRELRLRLGAAGPVELTLFDVRGRAQTLHDASLDAGEYAFSLDALLERPLSAGLYVLRAKTREFSETFRIAGTGDVARASSSSATVRRVAKGSAAIDTVVLEKEGYYAKRVALLAAAADLGDVELVPIPPNRTVTVSTWPAGLGAVSPGATNTVVDGEAFVASVARAHSAAGDTVVSASKSWNDAAHTAGDTVRIAAVTADMDLVDTISVLRVTQPRIGASFVKGDSVTLKFDGQNLPNNVFVVMCPDRNCAQTDTVLKNVSRNGGTFKFKAPTQWNAGNAYYLKVIVNDNFWARVKEITVNDPPTKTVTVAVNPANEGIQVGPAASNTVNSGASFKAWISLPAGATAAGDSVVYRQKGWNDAAHTTSDTVTLASVTSDKALVDTVSVLRFTQPRVGASFTKGDSVTVKFTGKNLPNNVDVVLCPDRNCAQTETVLSNLSKNGGTFKFKMPDLWPAANTYYLKAVVDGSFWARVKDISVADRPVSSSSSSSSSSSQPSSSSSAAWRNLSLQKSIAKAQPMTGIVFWATNYPGSTYNDATALEYLYCYPSKVVTGRSGNTIQYNWSSLDNLLSQVRGRKHQAIVRIAYENPNNSDLGSERGSTAVPQCIKKAPGYTETYSADPGGDGPTYYAGWGHDSLKWFAKKFLTDFASRYDTNSSVAFLQLGFGHWGEYHIYGTTLQLGTNFPSKSYQASYLRHAESVFQHLPWSFSIDAADDDYTPLADSAGLRALHYGLFDDSFMHSKHEYSQTNGGYNEGNWTTLGYTSHWQTSAMGGEINCWNDYYDHMNFLRPSGVNGLTWEGQASKYHITYMLAGHVINGSYGSTSDLLQGALKSGYKFRVTAFRTNGSQTQVTVKNEGVAPLYRDAYVAVGGTRSTTSLKGLLPGESLTATIPVSGDGKTPAIECDHTVGRPIEYNANL